MMLVGFAGIEKKGNYTIVFKNKLRLPCFFILYPIFKKNKMSKECAIHRH